MTPDARRALVFSATLLPLLMAALWLYPRALPLYERAVLALANPVLERLAPAVRVERDAGGGLVPWVTTLQGERRALTDGTYQPYAVFLSLVLLPPLLVATPGRAAERARRLVLGLALLYVVHVLSVIGLFRTALCLIRDPGSFGCQWLQGLVLTSGQLGAALIWALLTWGVWLRRPR